ncbi:MAG: hypothetical protein II821_01155 [Treponema sp.]|nr:hypothetical protein [Treponema sp.]
MKKLFILSALICAGVLFSASAKEKPEYKYEYQEAKVSYHNVQIYKVLDHKDAYIVMYAKGHRDVGTVTLPKKWYSSAMRVDSKLTFRPLPKGMNPYMTVISRDGAFERVLLTIPTSRLSPIWGIADGSQTVSDADKDTLDIQY